MHTTIQKAKRTCATCGAVQEPESQPRSVVDVVGASLLSLLVVGLVILFAYIFGLPGGRYSLAVIVGIPGLIIWALWKMVGSPKVPDSHCPSCGPREADSRFS